MAWWRIGTVTLDYSLRFYIIQQVKSFSVIFKLWEGIAELISYCARCIIWQTSNTSIGFVKLRTAYLTIRAIPIQDLFSSKQLETLSSKKHDV